MNFWNFSKYGFSENSAKMEKPIQYGGDDEINMMMMMLMLMLMVKTYMSWCTVRGGGGVGVSLGEQSKPISRF